jgi:hypothetical protein
MGNWAHDNRTRLEQAGHYVRAPFDGTQNRQLYYSGTSVLSCEFVEIALAPAWRDR